MAQGVDTNEIVLSMTQHGLNKLTKNGMYNTFVQYTVGEDDYRYDVTETPKLDIIRPGGTKKLVTLQNICHFAEGPKPLSKDPIPQKEKDYQGGRVKWVFENTDCDTNFEGNNIKVTYHLKRWENYLNTLLGKDNYKFENKMNLIGFNNVLAEVQEHDPSTYTYKTKKEVENIRFNYKFETQEDCDKYLALNSSTVVAKSGRRELVQNVATRRTSNLQLMFHSVDGKPGYFDNLIFTLVPANFGYVAKQTTDKTEGFNVGHFVDTKTIESMSQAQLNEKYRVILPACMAAPTSANADLFYFDDTDNAYGKSIDGLPTYAYQYVSAVDGSSLLERLLTKMKLKVQTLFTETGPATNVWEYGFKFKIDNKVVDNVTYERPNQRIGGHVEVNFVYDNSDLQNTLTSAVIIE